MLLDIVAGMGGIFTASVRDDLRLPILNVYQLPWMRAAGANQTSYVRLYVEIEI